MARARSLYQTALDVLGLTYPKAKLAATPPNPFGLDPLVEALRLHAQSNLRKLRLGRNIAGLERQLSPNSPPGPRSRHGNPRHTGTPCSSRGQGTHPTCLQMEAALLAALEKRDAESYNLLKAIQESNWPAKPSACRTCG